MMNSTGERTLDLLEGMGVELLVDEAVVAHVEVAERLGAVVVGLRDRDRVLAHAAADNWRED